MTTISIIGLGWMGEPLAVLLKEKGNQVKGSTTSSEKQEKLKTNGIDAIRFSLNPHPEGIGFNSLFQSEILVINIPPKTRSGNGVFHLEQLKYLRSLLDRSLVRKVIFVSSTGVYPELDSSEEYKEDFQINGENTGNDTLFRAEQRMGFEKNYDLTIVRFGGLLGDDRIPGKYFSRKENVVGHTRVNFIHRHDAVRMLAWIIVKEFWNETFNGVAPIHPQRKDIYEKNSAELGINPPFSYESEHLRTDRLISSAKILSTGFEFSYPDPLFFTYRKDQA